MQDVCNADTVHKIKESQARVSSAVTQSSKFWCDENVKRFLEGVKARHTKEPDSPYGPYHSKSQMMELIKSRYKSILTRNNLLKKNLYKKLNDKYLKDKQGENSMIYEEIQEMKK